MGSFWIILFILFVLWAVVIFNNNRIQSNKAKILLQKELALLKYQVNITKQLEGKTYLNYSDLKVGDKVLACLSESAFNWQNQLMGNDLLPATIMAKKDGELIDILWDNGFEKGHKWSSGNSRVNDPNKFHVIVVALN